MQSENTKAQIHQAAVELFTANGYEKTSLREIADRVGITKASLYYHYPSKQALLEAVVEPLVTDWRRTVDEAVALPHTAENVRLVLEHCLDTMLRHRPVAGLMLRDAASMFAALAVVWNELIELNTRLHVWLAGPRPTAVRRIRALAATEALSVALGSGALLPEVSDEDLRATLLGAAQAVLAG
ncbi:MAG TPA: helix-turn-helix domain-containing protein [Micromonosporaceae bacterium]|jgi:AcrR family transcriptional regulator